MSSPVDASQIALPSSPLILPYSTLALPSSPINFSPTASSPTYSIYNLPPSSELGPSSPIRTSYLSLAPPSRYSSTLLSDRQVQNICPGSQYPPGVDSIIRAGCQEAQTLQRRGQLGKVPSDGSTHSVVSDNSTAPSVGSIVEGRARRRLSIPDFPGCYEPAFGGRPFRVRTRDEAITYLQTACYKLDQIHAGMRSVCRRLGQDQAGIRSTCRRCFHTFMISVIEIPNLRPLRVALKKYIARLNALSGLLSQSIEDVGNGDIENLMVQLKNGLDYVLEEGSHILASWDRRESGQVPGVPLTDRDRRLHRRLIHDSNDRLEDLRKRIDAAEKLVGKPGENLKQDAQHIRRLVEPLVASAYRAFSRLKLGRSADTGRN